MSPNAAKFVTLIRSAKGRDLAKSGERLAHELGVAGPRDVRNIVARDHKEIIDLLAKDGAVLMSMPPHGYWLADHFDEIREQHRRLVNRKNAATAALRDFASNVEGAGLGAALKGGAK